MICGVLFETGENNGTSSTKEKLRCYLLLQLSHPQRCQIFVVLISRSNVAKFDVNGIWTEVVLEKRAPDDQVRVLAAGVDKDKRNVFECHEPGTPIGPTPPLR